ncbi:unnamed protein product [Aspergillus oryzae]|uniref:Unnamed protein product n=2 Tax=Aspergillus oryzae TaxID=5062 RepID=A0AAN5C275_ASPOZ|nr:unnamed protein product [Aspergillus oryzae]GMF89454.1 unnamed protein product [Aspergillus oryzae]GMG08617.1 unnamed protein product [Aspergillus oryzae]GMG34930.1 unnamed protein product [Aspergillus oryzae]GMG51517.1 unnamed protein product [Aspergillus oryzae var. brunneus]
MAEDMPTGGDPFPNPISGTTDEASWKHRPPYKVQTDEEFGPVKWTGRCQCGQVEYKINREKPLKSNRRAVEIPDGKPKWSELDDSSELLDDSGNPKKGES